MQANNPAFPINPKTQILGAEFVGLTKRELIAIAVYPEVIRVKPARAKFIDTANIAVTYADAMIEALNGAK